MVARTEVVKAAESRAYQIMDTAEAEARRLHHEVEDFCDQKLASFEIVLERTMKLVASGRQKLQGTNLLGEADDDQLDLPPPPDAPAPPAALRCLGRGAGPGRLRRVLRPGRRFVIGACPP